MSLDIGRLPPWEKLLKQMVWQQLGEIEGLRILDFGSGEGWTAAWLAQRNQVTAIEPSADMLSRQVGKGSYTQLQGGAELLESMPEASFDMILCHNVLEYVEDKAAALRALSRLLKPGGMLSLTKHNRPGRVMQMAVLLNDFEHAHSLLSGADGRSGQFGAIRYYEDRDVPEWLPGMHCVKLWGIRTFWDLQQNQQCHPDPAWQEKMLALETRVSTMPEYQAIAFFHHMIYEKQT